MIAARMVPLMILSGSISIALPALAADPGPIVQPGRWKFTFKQFCENVFSEREVLLRPDFTCKDGGWDCTWRYSPNVFNLKWKSENNGLWQMGGHLEGNKLVGHMVNEGLPHYAFPTWGCIEAKRIGD